MIESWYKTTISSATRGVNEAVLHQMFMEHFGELASILSQATFDEEKIQALGRELAQYCQGDPEVLGKVQIFLADYLNEQVGVSGKLAPLVLSHVAQGFTRQSQDLIFERYQLLIDNYHQSRQQLLLEKTQLALINDIGGQIAAVLDLDKLFSRAAELVQSAFGYQQVAIYVLQNEQAVLKAAAGKNEPSHTRPLDQAADGGVIGWVARHGRDYIANEAYGITPTTAGKPEITSTRSELCIPIKIGAKTVGVLDIHSASTDAFTAETVTTLHTLVDQLAVAIDNARLHNQLQEELRERSQVEDALRQSENKYRHIVESQTEMICRFKIDGRLTFTNRTYAFYFDLEPHELIGRSIFKFIYENDAEMVRARIEALSIFNPLVNYEHRVYLSDGSIGWHRWTTQGFFDDNDQLVEVQSVGRDITESKKLEEAMHRAQKLESLGVLAGGVAHDFNNLLAAISNESSLALLKQEPDQKAHLENIITITERAKGFTRQLLTYAGEGRAQLESVNLNEVIQDVLVIASASIPKTITVKSSLHGSIPNMDGDLGQLQQVVMNLIINAAESYDGEPGKVFIETKPYHGESGEPELLLQIRDEGCGMDKETLGRVFDPFFTTKLTGRGLGLAAVQGIVEAHRGDIWVESRLEQGTTFHLIFPAGSLRENAPAAAPISLPSTKTHQSILIVEDDQIIRRSTTEILTLKGFTVYTAENGLEGVEAYRQHQETIDLVILDMTMPVMSGDEALAEIRKLNEGLPVIVLSGYGKKEVMDSLEGMDNLLFLQKPYKLRDLIGHIETMFA